jgi:dolichol kinase
MNDMYPNKEADYQYLGIVYAGVLFFNVTRGSVAVAPSSSSKPASFRLPPNFDPAPLLYPSAIPLYVSLLISPDNQAVLLPNIILGLCSIPHGLLPRGGDSVTLNHIHWTLSCLPLFWQSQLGKLSSTSTSTALGPEALVLLYPLHSTLCDMLHYLTTTSLLTTELHLLSIALINVLILATSPQARILKALLWVGGLGILISCSTVIQWEVALARVPKWRFKRLDYQKRVSLWKRLTNLLTWRKIQYELVGPTFESADYDEPVQNDESSPNSNFFSRAQTMGPAMDGGLDANSPPSSPSTGHSFAPVGRRQTISSLDKPSRRTATHTASGRKKRSTSISVRPYLKFTQTQALVRKWIYAAYIYVAILGVVFVGVRTYIQLYALQGEEPIGWGLGYAFGDLPWFRFQVVNANLERWICLPSRADPYADKQCGAGWVQRIRHNDFGEANTRLFITGYWVGILTLGLLVVFRLTDTYEVDTRRKVFHFMMVGMFLPATFVDPTFAALCLSLALAIFLILDLIRASQLPPLSKPIASFLAPYVDGRDFRGPVVISHIFLLIGCAIPLWLALASLPRSGSGYQAGWEMPTRDASMVAGVICVGLGDAAASLIGRRYGHRKWLWGGGKSLEGSVAFALAVFVGLVAASAWLRVGGWSASHEETGVLASATNAAVCGSLASLTEAVLTGGNDNVIVPVILWTCVKGLGV